MWLLKITETWVSTQLLLPVVLTTVHKAIFKLHSYNYHRLHRCKEGLGQNTCLDSGPGLWLHLTSNQLTGHTISTTNWYTYQSISDCSLWAWLNLTSYWIGSACKHSPLLASDLITQLGIAAYTSKPASHGWMIGRSWYNYLPYFHSAMYKGNWSTHSGQSHDGQLLISQTVVTGGI